MSTTTANYGLIKPERSDNYNVDVMAENMDALDAKVYDIESSIRGGDINPDTINVNHLIAEEITGDISNCLNVSTDANVISSVYVGGSLLLAERHNMNNGSSDYGAGTTTKTFTYRSNPFSNKCTFSMHLTSTGWQYVPRGIIKVNDEEVCNYSYSYDSKNATVYRDFSIELNDGDLVTVIASMNESSGCGLKIYLVFNGFLTH